MLPRTIHMLTDKNDKTYVRIPCRKYGIEFCSIQDFLSHSSSKHSLEYAEDILSDIPLMKVKEEGYKIVKYVVGLSVTRY